MILKIDLSGDYKIDFIREEDFLKFRELGFNIIRIQEQYNQVTCRVNLNDLNNFLKEVSKYKVKFISEINYNLSTYFKERKSMKNE